MYITIEGLPSAPTRAVSEGVFGRLDRAARWTEQPSGLWTGQLARKAEDFRDADLYARLYARLADVAQHDSEIVRPALGGDFAVVSDRGPDSIRAQYVVLLKGRRENPGQFVEYNLQEFCTPDLTLFVSVEPTALEPVDRTEQSSGFRRRVHRYYLALADNTRRVVVLDGDRDVDAIVKDALAETSRFEQ